MKTEIIQSLTNNFEEHSYTTEQGVEFWFARELQQLLGYAKWENFNKVITKTKIACEINENNTPNHFPDVRKTIQMPKGAVKEIDDFMLTRYACCLIAQNGDQKKETRKKSNQIRQKITCQ